MEKISRLFVKNQKFSRNIGFNLEGMHFNIESLACNNTETHVIIDHYLKKTAVYNYNNKLYSLLGNARNHFDFTVLTNSVDSETKRIILMYIDVANKIFVHPTKYIRKNLFFSISFNINDNLCMNGLRFRLVPMVYTPEKQLYASLLLIENISHIGEPILEMFLTDKKTSQLYDRVSRSFVDKENIQLSVIECDVLIRSGEGEKETDIACALDLSISGLKRVKQSIFEKLKVKTISEAIYIAYKKGLI